MSKRAKRAPLKKPMDTDPFEYEIVCKAPPVPPGEPPQTGRNKRKSDGRPSTTVTLSIPMLEDECPLTLDSIGQSKLEIMPDTPFMEGKPLHTKMTLPCGHSFCAMVLIYSWCKNNMTCPCCRAGHQHKADMECLPGHFRSAMADHVKSTLASERIDDESNLEIITVENVFIPFNLLALHGDLTLRLEFFDFNEQPGRPTRPIFTSNSDLIPLVEMNDSGSAFVPRGQLRTISHIMHMGVNHMRLSIQVNVGAAGRMIIDHSDMINLQQSEGNNRLFVEGTRSALIGGEDYILRDEGDVEDNRARFEIVFTTSQISRNLRLLSNVIWRPGSQRLELTSVAVQG